MNPDKLYIENILKSVLLIEEYLKGVSFDKFKKNSMLIDAVSKRFEEIGENSLKVSLKLKLKHKEVRWINLSKNRNFLVYGLVNVRRIYQEAAKEIPKLKIAIKKIKKEIK